MEKSLWDIGKWSTGRDSVFIMDIPEKTGTGYLLADKNAAVFPAMVFILGAVLAFTTGSDWGMSSIITPIVFPLGAALGANPVLIMAAVISGGTFGSHACFYSDATLLAAQSAGVDSMEQTVKYHHIWILR